MSVLPKTEQDAIQDAFTRGYDRGWADGNAITSEDLRSENTELSNLNEGLEYEISELRRPIAAQIADALQGRFDDLIEALRFYAASESYRFLPRPAPIDVDQGAKARAVLARYANDDEGERE